MKCFVTGCAGFIGSHLTARLLTEDHEVVGFDNFSTGRESFIAPHPRFKLIRGDLLSKEAVIAAMKGSEIVFHLAANADVRYGTDHPHKDLEQNKQNTIATFHVLEAMRLNGIKRLVFSSTGSVYGESS